MAAKYQAYMEYKNANSKWLDTLPLQWRRLPLKYVVLTKITDGPHETPDFVDDGVVFISAEAVKNNKLDFSKKRGYISEKLHKLYSKKCLPMFGDIFLVKSGSTTGAVAIVETYEEFNIWSPLALIRANPEIVKPLFIYYSLCANFFKSSIELSWSFGTQPNIGMSVIENLHIPVPSILEQEKITNFLDHETAKIDTLIEKQQQLIALLKEKRQAVISHAVTKGLNPHVKMKDSGVEWLGEVPEHWEVGTLKYYANILDCKHITAEFFDEGYPLASIGEVKEWVVNLNNAKLTNEKFYLQLIDGERKPRTGDIIYSRNATVGEAALVIEKLPDFAMGQDVCLIRCYECTDSNFILNILKSSIILQQLELAMVGSTFKRINVDNIRNFIMVHPPTHEQQQINSYLVNIRNKYDNLIERAQQQIELLQERSTALISAAVTGKIDVREWRT